MNVLRVASYITLALILAFLITVATLMFGELKAAKEEADRTSAQRARLGAALLKAEVEHKGVKPVADLEGLRRFARRYSLERVLITDARGVPLADTGDESGAMKRPPQWFPPGGADTVIRGGGLFSINFLKDKKTPVAAAVAAAKGEDDRTVLVAVVSRRPLAGNALSERALMVILLSFMLFGLVYIVLRLYPGRTREAERGRDSGGADTAGGGSQVGFVVDTFHGLVSKLKEKEGELETLRKTAELRADTAEEYNENILQSVTSGVISTDGELRVRKANASAESILGIRSGDIAGKPIAELLPSLDKYLKDEEQVERADIQYMNPQGKRLWLGFSLTPLLDSGRNTIGRLFVFSDLTELKALEEQAALRQRLSSLGEMAAGIAHELRNPMAVIAGYMKMLSKKVDDPLQGTVDAVSAEVSAMDDIIEDFLHFAGTREPALQNIGLKGLVEDSARAVLKEGNGVELELEVDGSLEISADEVLMRQAFCNLIKNAADSMPRGGVITVRAEQAYGFVDVYVSDTGHGMPEKIKEKIFLPFYSTKDSGTGLGLAVVHRTVSSHGGSIDVESTSEGTTFRLRLPAAR